MTKLTKRAIRYLRTDGRTDPKYRKASLLKRLLILHLGNHTGNHILQIKNSIKSSHDKLNYNIEIHNIQSTFWQIDIQVLHRTYKIIY